MYTTTSDHQPEEWIAATVSLPSLSALARTFAATAALGRTSSQPSLSTRTSTPVSCVNFLVLANHMSSSPCTKRFQRSTRSLAPASGL